MLGRIETRTRDRIYCQTIRTVRDISRDDRARIATCGLRTPTDRQTDRQADRFKENYSIGGDTFISSTRQSFDGVISHIVVNKFILKKYTFCVSIWCTR